MQRKLRCIAGVVLAAALVFIIAGCSCNPMSSEVVIPSDQPANQDVVSEYVVDDASGGIPVMGPMPTPEKYESDEEPRSD